MKECPYCVDSENFPIELETENVDNFGVVHHYCPLCDYYIDENEGE